MQSYAARRMNCARLVIGWTAGFVIGRIGSFSNSARRIRTPWGACIPMRTLSADTETTVTTMFSPRQMHSASRRDRISTLFLHESNDCSKSLYPRASHNAHISFVARSRRLVRGSCLNDDPVNHKRTLTLAADPTLPSAARSADHRYRRKSHMAVPSSPRPAPSSERRFSQVGSSHTALREQTLESSASVPLEVTRSTYSGISPIHRERVTRF